MVWLLLFLLGTSGQNLASNPHTDAGPKSVDDILVGQRLTRGVSADITITGQVGCCVSSPMLLDVPADSFKTSDPSSLDECISECCNSNGTCVAIQFRAGSSLGEPNECLQYDIRGAYGQVEEGYVTHFIEHSECRDSSLYCWTEPSPNDIYGFGMGFFDAETLEECLHLCGSFSSCVAVQFPDPCVDDCICSCVLHDVGVALIDQPHQDYLIYWKQLCDATTGSCCHTNQLDVDIVGYGFNAFFTETLEDCISECCSDPRCSSVQYSENPLAGNERFRCIFHQELRTFPETYQDYRVYFVDSQCEDPAQYCLGEPQPQDIPTLGFGYIETTDVNACFDMCKFLSRCTDIQFSESCFIGCEFNCIFHEGGDVTESQVGDYLTYKKELCVLDETCDEATEISIPSSTTGSNVASPSFPSDVIAQDCMESVDLTNFNGMWYTMIGTGGDVTINTCNSPETGFDSVIAVFSGGCTNLQCLGINDDGCFLQSRLSINTNQGGAYHVFVGGAGTGTFVLDVEEGIQQNIDREEFTFSESVIPDEAILECVSNDTLTSSTEVESGAIIVLTDERFFDACEVFWHFVMEVNPSGNVFTLLTRPAALAEVFASADIVAYGVVPEELTSSQDIAARNQARDVSRGISQQGETPTPEPTPPVVLPPNEAPTSPPAEPPSEPPSQPPFEPPSEPPVEPPSQPPVEPPSEPPFEPPSEQPAEPPSQPPVGSPTEEFHGTCLSVDVIKDTVNIEACLETCSYSIQRSPGSTTFRYECSFTAKFEFSKPVDSKLEDADPCGGKNVVFSRRIGIYGKVYGCATLTVQVSDDSLAVSLGVEPSIKFEGTFSGTYQSGTVPAAPDLKIRDKSADPGDDDIELPDDVKCPDGRSTFGVGLKTVLGAKLLEGVLDASVDPGIVLNSGQTLPHDSCACSDGDVEFLSDLTIDGVMDFKLTLSPFALLGNTGFSIDLFKYNILDETLLTLDEECESTADEYIECCCEGLKPEELTECSPNSGVETDCCSLLGEDVDFCCSKNDTPICCEPSGCCSDDTPVCCVEQGICCEAGYECQEFRGCCPPGATQCPTWCCPAGEQCCFGIFQNGCCAPGTSCCIFGCCDNKLLQVNEDHSASYHPLRPALDNNFHIIG